MDVQSGPAEQPLPRLIWRAMNEADLDAAAAIAAVSFPDHFEDRDCFANRLDLHPAGCFVLADGEAVAGYLIAYPWMAETAPALNARIAALPEAPDLIYLHDLALAPRARGGGWTRTIVERLADQARADGWSMIGLVAVNDAAGFWARHGFRVRESETISKKLAGYGSDARYMIREL